jgi:AraC family transcriptional regulator
MLRGIIELGVVYDRTLQVLLYGGAGAGFLAEIAAVLKRAVKRRAAKGTPGGTVARVLARGAGWSVADVVCTAGPGDRQFEEQHRNVCIAVVAAGSFQYRSHAGRALLGSGSLLLGSAGQAYECGHEHAKGDRCISFLYAPEYFELVTADAGAGTAEFRVPALPPMRAMSWAVARACAGLAGDDVDQLVWEELSLRLAVETLRLANGDEHASREMLPSAEARVTRVVRMMEERPDAEHSLARLAEEARLSPYHFLRTFQSVVGLTPHQYVMRMRLRRAAVRLVQERTSVLDVALDCGFGDVSNFNRSFRAEFGVSPRVFRRGEGAPPKGKGIV